MDELRVRKDWTDKKGNILFKANVPYYPKGEDTVNNKRYLVYDCELKGEEILIPIE